MSKQLKQLEKHTFNAEEALNIIFSDLYTLGTSSSDKSFLNCHIQRTALIEMQNHLLQNGKKTEKNITKDK